MARTREFDTTRALIGAMEIFWRQGFKATNLPELLQAMGLTRGSFYKAFRDKENVYLKALDEYDIAVVAKTLDALKNCNAPLASDCLMQIFKPSTNPKQGCFICNAMVELAPDNPLVAAKTNAMANRLKLGIIGVLEKHKIGKSKEHRLELGDVLLHLYFGHQAMGKSCVDQSNWQARLKRILGEA
ncbi:MAG: TetR/AcrR family transcriptional regulator [Lentilitoribacter sp.]